MDRELPTLNKVAHLLLQSRDPDYRALGQSLVVWLERDWPESVDAASRLVPDARHWQAISGYAESLLVVSKELKRTKKADYRRIAQLQNSMITLGRSIADAIEEERRQEPG